MKQILLLTTLLLFSSAQFQNAQTKSEKEVPLKWWNSGYNPPQPFKSTYEKKLPLIQVKGNRFVNSNGDTVLFRGLAIADPDKLEGQGHWNKEHFEKVKEMGAMIVRIPVHPIAWRERTPEKYLKLLEQAVEWCTELDMYIDIDWHSIGNLKMELFQDPSYNTSVAETNNFWRTIARHFAGNNTIAFYEIFNEPTLYFGQLGRMSWEDWKEINEDIIATIRAYDKETIPLVAGFDWAYDLTPILISPIEAEGIGYVTHPYPHKRSQPWEPKWDENFGFATDRYPVVATEFGFVLGKYGLADNEDYGNRIITYLEGKGISWFCWIFDPEWFPMLLKSWDTYELTEGGEFFKKAMQGKLKMDSE
jgi:aryl-phospho-beta-D-glucosidase BglC (GH1 family)